MVVLTRIVRIAKANRITTISDFLGFRYGKSLLLSALVAAVAVIGVIPYIGLQIKAIISTFEIISH
jgi:Na+/proline symporter